MQVIKKAVSKELCNFLTHYIRNYKKAIAYMMHEKVIAHDMPDFGTWQDQQAPQTFSHYSNHAIETLMEQLTPVIEKATGKELYEVFSYVRAYNHMLIQGIKHFYYKDLHGIENLHDWAPIFLPLHHGRRRYNISM